MTSHKILRMQCMSMPLTSADVVSHCAYTKLKVTYTVISLAKTLHWKILLTRMIAVVIDNQHEI